MLYLLNKGIYYFQANTFEICGVRPNDDQIVHKRGCSDLLIKEILRTWHTKPPPNLGNKRIEFKNFPAVIKQALVKPIFHQKRLISIAPIA